MYNSAPVCTSGSCQPIAESWLVHCHCYKGHGQESFPNTSKCFSESLNSSYTAAGHIPAAEHTGESFHSDYVQGPV
ncbi:hypothetical protein GN956_G2210 [Arapaima gigas]